MTYEQFVNDLTYYCRTVLNDMDQMVAVADSVAQQEVDSYATEGKLIPPTTDPLGRNLEAYTYIPSRCTVPLSMLCFSVIDFIGRLLDKGYKGGEEDGSADNFIRYARNFFESLAGRDDLQRDETSTKLKINYRNSIMHTFLPSSTFRRGYSVSYSHIFDEQTLFCKWEQEKDVLNVKCLTNIVRTGVQKLEDLIQDRGRAELLFKNYNVFLEHSDQKYRS